jgi:hypothetical protein
LFVGDKSIITTLVLETNQHAGWLGLINCWGVLESHPDIEVTEIVSILVFDGLHAV